MRWDNFQVKIMFFSYFFPIGFLDSEKFCGKHMKTIGFKEIGIIPESKNNSPLLGWSKVREFEKKKRERERARDWRILRQHQTIGTRLRDVSAKVLVNVMDTAWGTKSYITKSWSTDYLTFFKVSTTYHYPMLAALTTSGLSVHLLISSWLFIQRRYKILLIHDLVFFWPSPNYPHKVLAYL